MVERVALIDNDGVLVAYRLEMVKQIACILGKPQNEQFIEHFYKTTLHLDDSELLNAFSNPSIDLHYVLNSDDEQNFGATAPAYQGALDALKILKAHNFKNVIVTARTEKMRPGTLARFVELGMTPYIDDVVMRAKNEIRPADFKVTAARQINASHAFEDTYENLHRMCLACPTLKHAYLIDQDWNRKHYSDELYPTLDIPIERMDSFNHATLDAVATLK